MDSLAGAPPHTVASRPSQFPGREDCWSEEATFTLVDAWGERYRELNRGNLRQKHWQEVADAVNDRHGHDRKARRTDVQCKNRIDTLKKKYKIEKARVTDSGDYVGTWPFFHDLDSLIGDTYPAMRPSPPAISGGPRDSPPTRSPAWTLAPVGRRSVTQKRSPAMVVSPAIVEDKYFQQKLSAFAEAAAAAAEAEKDSENWKGKKRGRKDSEFGYREVADAIERFGAIYERVELAKQRQMAELEKQRMQFAKDLEFQRMQLFMETQVQLQKTNSSKRSSTPDSFTSKR